MKAVVVAAESAFLERNDRTLEEFIFETVSGAISRWNLGIDDIDGIVTASSDQLDGRGISIMLTAASVGGYAKDVMNLCSASEHALFYQTARVLAGRTALGLVVAWGKPSEGLSPEVARIAADPFFGRIVPREREAWLAMEASACPSHGIDEAALEALAPFYTGEVKYADCCSVMLIAPEDAAPAHPDKLPPLRIAASGLAIQSYWTDEAAAGRWPSLGIAARSARERAGLASFAGEIDVYELSTLTPAQEAIAAIELGLATSGHVGAYAKARAAGDISVNASGGLRGAYPDFASGLLSVVRACEELWKVPSTPGRPARALAHGTSGTPAQAHSVFVFEATHE